MGDPTFRDLGIPFPLYEGSLSTCSHYAGEGACDLCGGVGHRFRFEAGGALTTPCATCSTDVVWYVAVGPGSCGCGGRARPATFACYACFRAGRAVMSHDSERGAVVVESAPEGFTHGLPGPLPPGMVAEGPFDEDGWCRVRAESAGLLELLRTPSYVTWQGELWLFHCEAPMVFVGEWKAEALLARTGGDEGQADALIRELLDDGRRPLRLGDLDAVGGLYVFRCVRCGQHRARYDLD